MTQRSDAGEPRTRALRSRVKHSTTEPLRSLKRQILNLLHDNKKNNKKKKTHDPWLLMCVL